MSIHYRLKSCKDFNTVPIDGIHISVGDLKKTIIQQKKLGTAECYYQIADSNDPTKVYERDEDLIPKNSSVVVSRLPLADKPKRPWNRGSNNDATSSSSSGRISIEKVTKSSDLSSYATEEEKIAAMVTQSTDDYDSSRYQRQRGHFGPLPPNYTCYRCGQGGHYIKNCPTNNMDIKRSTGIPRSFMLPASADQKGAMLTSTGDYAVPVIDMEAYKVGKTEKPFISMDQQTGTKEPDVVIPEQFKCFICKNILRDAVLTPCCGDPCCDDCIRTALIESESHECPLCHETAVSPDNLLPSRKMRNDIIAFQKESSTRI